MSQGTQSRKFLREGHATAPRGFKKNGLTPAQTASLIGSHPPCFLRNREQNYRFYMQILESPIEVEAHGGPAFDRISYRKLAIGTAPI